MARRHDVDELAAGRRSRRSEEPESARRIWIRYGLWTVLGLGVMVGSLFAWHRTEDFLIKDSRFRVREAGGNSEAASSLKLDGVHYSSSAFVRRTFAHDFGRSLYMVPLKERRRQLLAIDWIEDASVGRVWPNTIYVKVRERTPVAFVHLPSGPKTESSRYALIDRDGYILRPRIAAKFTLPVLAGIREQDDLESRGTRVRRVLEMVKELGPMASQISEIDVSEQGNIKIAKQMDGRLITLLMGDENFASRMTNFVNNYSEIKSTRPDATTLDLRVDDRITVIEGVARGQ